MEDGRASRTAAQNALFRALDARAPRARRIADDQLSVWFLTPEFRLLAGLARVPVLRRGIESIIDRRWPCARGGVVARTRVLDDAISSALAGTEQVVILGAGFDSRPHRLPAMRGVSVYEVDHPATQAAKRRALSRHHRADTCRVRFVPVVFGSDDPTNALLDAGFGLGRPTLVLWEGVTNYLDATSVDATLRLVADLVGPGSPLFFTYVHVGILDGSTTFAGAATTMAAVRRVGEPFTFGFEPTQVPEYLAARGFELCWDRSVAEAGRPLYAAAPAPSLPDYYRVVAARRR